MRTPTPWSRTPETRPCAACTHPVDLTTRHVTVARHVEQLGPDGTITVHHAEVVATLHIECAGSASGHGAGVVTESGVTR